MKLSFEVLSQVGLARRGRLTLNRGVVETPVFMPVGTLGTVKSLTPEEILSSGSQIILGNTYHLYLRPGLEVLEAFKGLNSFMGWKGPILTDSGGFQVFSLGKLKTVTDEGVVFQSHLNGDTIHLTPELSHEIQRVIGSDIAMVLDECLPLPSTEQALRGAVERSQGWAKRFLDGPRLPNQKIFGIVQGGTHFGLRTLSLSGLLELPLDGIAVGGLSVGEPRTAMLEVLDALSNHLPAALPHYLMGVGTPCDILESVRLGIDMFDCVLPTRNARNGGFFTPTGLLNIRNSQYRLDKGPIQDGCNCYTCQHFSRAYLRHLFLSKEILGPRLATLHNVHYYHRFMAEIRKVIELGTFEAYYQSVHKDLKAAYPEHKTEMASNCLEEK